MARWQINTSHFYLSIVDTKRSPSRVDARNLKQLKKGMNVAMAKCEKFLFSKNGPVGLNKKLQDSVHLNLVLCGKNKIRSLNREHRSKDRVTDVLSFPVHDDLRKSSRMPVLPGPVELGDLYICREVADSQAREFSITYCQEIYHLFIHGFLHLLGYDHERSAKDEKEMLSLEDKLVKSIYNGLDKD